MSWDYLFVQAANGAVVGVIYALIAVGVTLIFSILKIVNFAHGDLYMLGGYCAYYVIEYLGVPPLGAMVVSMAAPPDLSLRLNNHTSPQAGDICLGVVPDYGSVNEPNNLALCLAHTFQQRLQTRAYKVGMETRADLKEEERIEKTVFVKAPRAMKYGDVVKVIDAIKGAGASPVGLQVDDLP